MFDTLIERQRRWHAERERLTGMKEPLYRVACPECAWSAEERGASLAGWTAREHLNSTGHVGYWGLKEQPHKQTCWCRECYDTGRGMFA